MNDRASIVAYILRRARELDARADELEQRGMGQASMQADALRQRVDALRRCVVEMDALVGDITEHRDRKQTPL